MRPLTGARPPGAPGEALIGLRGLSLAFTPLPSAPQTWRLISAVRCSNNLALLDELLLAGADANTTDTPYRDDHERGGYGGTLLLKPLHFAAVCSGTAEAVARLVGAGAHVEAECTWSYCGKVTPLMQASNLGNAEVVEALLSAGADPLRTDSEGRSALHYASMGGQAAVLSRLLQAVPGFDVNAVGEVRGPRPLASLPAIPRQRCPSPLPSPPRPLSSCGCHFCERALTRARRASPAPSPRQRLVKQWSTYGGALPPKKVPVPSVVGEADTNNKALVAVLVAAGGRLPTAAAFAGPMEEFLKATRAESGVVQAEPGALLPPGLSAALERQLDALWRARPVDAHPGSGGKVHDLIHPSLFCYRDGRSPLWARRVRAGSAEPAAAAADSVAPGVLLGRKLLPAGGALCAWLPSEVDVSADGRVSFASYVNTLDGWRWAGEGLRTSIAGALEALLPLFEESLGKADFPYWHKNAAAGNPSRVVRLTPRAAQSGV